MMKRLIDNDYLMEFGLAYQANKLKMSFSPGRTLIDSEELDLLAGLLGMPTGHDG